MRFTAAVLCLAMTIATTGCSTVKVHPEFDERHKSMKHITLLPPDVQAYEVTFNAGNKPLKDLMESMKAETAATMEKVMKQKGYRVTSLPLKQEDLDANPELKSAFFELNKLYQQAIKDMNAGKKKEFTYSVGSAGNYFAEKYNANAIVVVRETGSRLSGGMTGAKVAEATLSIVAAALTGVAVSAPGQPLYSLTVETAVIDADLGDVLWYNLKAANDNFTNPGTPNTVIKFVQDTIAPFPDSKFKSQMPVEEVSAKPAGSNLTPKNTASLPVTQPQAPKAVV